MKDKVCEAFRVRFGREPEIVVRAPGRVNLLGEHVDYNEGWVLPAAIDQAVWLAAARSRDGHTQIKALDFEGREASLEMDQLTPRPPDTSVTWQEYPKAVAWTLLDEGHRLPEMVAAYTADIPIGAGVSSSAAVEVAFLAAWNQLGALGLSSATMARLGQKSENQYIGLASGIMDQFASIHGRRGQLVLLDCRTLEHELVPFPPDCAILVVDSGIRRELAGSEYNVRRSQCEQAVAILQNYLPDIQTLRDVPPATFELLAHHLPVTVRRRARHVVEECRRVLEGAESLKRGDVVTFGRFMQQSHISLRDLYEVSIPELDLLAATAWQIDGCYGARLTGAGFGGCVVVLADAGAAASLGHAVSDAYQAATGRSARIFATSAADGVTVTEP